MQRYALVTGLSNEEPAIIELLHEGPQRPLGVGLNLPKHGRNYPYKAHQYAADGRRAPFSLRLRLHYKGAVVRGVKGSREFSVSKEELSPEDQAYYKRFEVKPLRVLLYFLAVLYLVFVFAVGGSQFSGGFFSGAVGSFILIQGIDLSHRRLIVIGGFLTVVSVLQTISLVLP